MSDFRKYYSLGFNFVNQRGCTWGKNPSTTFSFNFYSVGAYCNYYVGMKWENGRFPLFEEVQYAMRVFLKKALKEKVLKTYERIGAEKFRFIRKEGEHFNFTLFLERSALDMFSYPKQTKLLYVSGEGKIDGIRKMRLEDFILLAVWMGVLVPSRDEDDPECIRFWVTPKKSCWCPSRCRVIEPRNTIEEEGWYDPFTVPFSPDEVRVN